MQCFDKNDETHNANVSVAWTCFTIRFRWDAQKMQFRTFQFQEQRRKKDNFNAKLIVTQITIYIYTVQCVHAYSNELGW